MTVRFRIIEIMRHCSSPRRPDFARKTSSIHAGRADGRARGLLIARLSALCRYAGMGSGRRGRSNVLTRVNSVIHSDAE